MALISTRYTTPQKQIELGGEPVYKSSFLTNLLGYKNDGTQNTWGKILGWGLSTNPISNIINIGRNKLAQNTSSGDTRENVAEDLDNILAKNKIGAGALKLASLAIDPSGTLGSGIDSFSGILDKTAGGIRHSAESSINRFNGTSESTGKITGGAGEHANGKSIYNGVSNMNDPLYGLSNSDASNQYAEMIRNKTEPLSKLTNSIDTSIAKGTQGKYSQSAIGIGTAQTALSGIGDIVQGGALLSTAGNNKSKLNDDYDSDVMYEYYKKGGKIKRNMVDDSDNAKEDIDMIDKETGKKIGEISYGERVFDKKANKKMEELKKKNNYKSLGKMIADEMDTHENTGKYNTGGEIKRNAEGKIWDEESDMWVSEEDYNYPAYKQAGIRMDYMIRPDLRENPNYHPSMSIPNLNSDAKIKPPYKSIDTDYMEKIAYTPIDNLKDLPLSQNLDAKDNVNDSKAISNQSKDNVNDKDEDATNKTSVAGLLGDVWDLGRYAIGVQGAKRPLPSWERGNDWREYYNKAKDLSRIGLTTEENATLENNINRQYQNDVYNISNTLGGGAGTGSVIAGLALAGANAQRQRASNTLTDIQQNRNNVARYGNVLTQDLNYDRMEYSDRFNKDANAKNAFSQLAQTSLQHYLDDKLYDKVYGKGSSFDKLLKAKTKLAEKEYKSSLTTQGGDPKSIWENLITIHKTKDEAIKALEKDSSSYSKELYDKILEESKK